MGFEKLDPRILPEMSVKVAFQSAGEAAVAQRTLAIPRTAVRQRDGQAIVWLVREGRVERRAVTLGPDRGEEVTIVAGLGGGDRVVVNGPDNLVEGVSVMEAAQ